jgi:hypothetical protein
MGGVVRRIICVIVGWVTSRGSGLSAVLVIVLLGNPAEAQRAELAKARAAYNQQQFDEAIAAALTAQKVGATADAATVVLSRSYLERYRQGANPTDLAAARAQLGTVRVDNLDSRDHVDFIMALGEALFFEDDFGAAAAMFESGIETAQAQGAATGEAMLDWWGSAIERQSEALERGQREVVFARMRDRMTKELARNPGSAGAAYWSVVAARGAGDALGAWDAAVAAWVRARLAGSRAAQLRADLDKQVLVGIIPDRVRAFAPERRGQAESDLRTEWAVLKERWK